jgi:hypothetical protein
VIKEVLPLLELFNTSTLILSQNSAHTIQLVIQIKKTILSNLEIDKNESKTVQTFENILKSNIEKYLKIHFIHKFVLVFDPKRKDLKYLIENDKKEVLEVLKENMKSLSTQIEIESQTLRSKEPVKKKQKMILSQQFLCESHEESEETEPSHEYENEIDSYIKSKISTSNI